MNFEIKIKTPGAHLSMRTLNAVTSDITKQIELGVYDAIINEYPSASKTKIKKHIRGHVDLSLSEAEKGSWELVFIGIVTVIATISANLISDLAMSSEQWKQFKKNVIKMSDQSADNVKERLSKKNKLGPYNIDNRSISVKKSNKNTSILQVQADLKPAHLQTNKIPVPHDIDEQVDRLIEELQNNNKPNN